MDNRVNVGYIGLGNIGKPSARHLIGERYLAHVYDIHEPAVAELVALGALASSIEHIAKSCSHIGICVRDEEQVERVLYGDAGLLRHARADSIIAVHSTVGHTALLKWSADARAQGVHLIDAPITGGAQGAEDGCLCYMVGGSPEVIARAEPVFKTSASKVVHAGELGTGIILKLCNNLITYAEFMAMSEAMRLAEAGGLSADILREVGESNVVINESMHRFISNRNALAKTCSEQQMDEFFGVFGRLGEKDLDCALASAADFGVQLPFTARLRESVLDLFLNKA